MTTTYDAAGRPTLVSYPDGTSEQTIYNKLDPEQKRDRLGRWTRFVYDAARRLTATRDPLGRMVTQEWCSCGSAVLQMAVSGFRQPRRARRTRRET